MNVEFVICNIILPVFIALATSFLAVKGELLKQQREYELTEKQKRREKKYEMLGDLYNLATVSLGSIDLMCPTIEALPPEEERQKIYWSRYKKAVDGYNSFSSFFVKSSPFIPKDLFDLFNEIRKNNSYYINRYYDDKFSGVDIFKIEPLERIEIMKRNKDSSEKLIQVLETIRTDYYGVENNVGKKRKA